MLTHIYLFGAKISIYWLFHILGVAAAAAVLFVKRRKTDISQWNLLQLLALYAIGSVCGAKLMYAIGQILMHSSQPLFWTLDNWKAILSSGGVFYGGLIGGTTLALLSARKNKFNIRNIIDMAAVAIPTYGAVARIGCLFAGCCYGIEVRHMFTIPDTIYAVPRVPSPLLETGLNLVILLAFLIWRPEHKRPGILFPLYLLLYSIGRFVLEFFRGDASRGIWLYLSTSQWIGIVLIVGATLWLIKIARKKRKSEATI